MAHTKNFYARQSIIGTKKALLGLFIKPSGGKRRLITIDEMDDKAFQDGVNSKQDKLKSQFSEYNEQLETPLNTDMLLEDFEFIAEDIEDEIRAKSLTSIVKVEEFITQRIPVNDTVKKLLGKDNQSEKSPKKLSKELFNKFDDTMSKILSLRELPNVEKGEKLRDGLEDLLNQVYKYYDSDTVNALFDSVPFFDGSHGGNALAKYDAAIDRLNMLIDDIKEFGSDDEDNDTADDTDWDHNFEETEEEKALNDQIDAELQHRHDKETGKGTWRQKLDTTFTTRMYNMVKDGKTRPVSWDDAMGLMIGKIPDSTVVIPADEQERVYKEVNGNITDFRHAIINGHPDYRKELIGREREMGYDAKNEFHEIGEWVTSAGLDNDDRQVERVIAPVPTGKQKSRAGYKFKNASSIDGRLIRVIDTSQDNLEHDEVYAYLWAKDEHSEGAENFNRFQYMGIVLYHYKEGKQIADPQFITLLPAIDKRTMHFKDNAVDAIVEKMYRTSLANNAFQSNYKTDQKQSLDHNQALKDWQSDMNDFWSKFNYDEAMTHKDYWGEMVEPLFGWRARGRKDAYYRKVISNDDRQIIYQAGVGKYYDDTMAGKVQYDYDHMKSLLDAGFKQLLDKASD